jgi:hypothetical protein
MGQGDQVCRHQGRIDRVRRCCCPRSQRGWGGGRTQGARRVSRVRYCNRVIGIGIGKNAFHVVGHDKLGAIVLRQRWSGGRGDSETQRKPGGSSEPPEAGHHAHHVVLCLRRGGRAGLSSGGGPLLLLARAPLAEGGKVLSSRGSGSILGRWLSARPI